MPVSNLIVDLSPEPYPSYQFTVYIQAMRMGFSKITRMEDAIETEPLQEGGLNDYPHSLIAPRTQEHIMVFERGMAYRGALYAGATMRFHVGQRLNADIVITAAGRDGALQNMFLVHGAVVKRWTCSDLDAMSSNLMVEQFEVAYETFESLPTIAGTAGALGVPNF